MKAVSFIVGILVGMVLLVVAVGGAVLVTASVVTVGQIESSVGTDIIDDNSDVNDKTLLDLANDLIKDFGDPSSITINLFREKYGLKIPAEISGIDISVLFDYPISEVANHLGDVVNNMTLRDVGEFLEMDFSSYGLKVLDDNLDKPVNVALDNVLKSIDSSAMTLYTLERDFGITLGENALFDELYHTPMSQFGGVLDYLPVGTLTDADSDLFLPVGENTVFVSVDRYEAVATNEISLTADGAETYIAGADNNGLIRRELRFTVDDKGVYSVDNSCYDADYDGTGTYYRHIVYEPYDGTQEGELSVKAYLNNIELVGSGWSLVYDGLFPLSALYTDDTLSVSLADGVTSGTVVIGDSCFFNSAAEGETKVAEAVAVFGLPDGTVVDENTRLEEKKDGVSYTADHIRAHIGTADQAIQVIAGIGVNRLNNVTDKITSLKLGEVLEITDDSAKILRTLKDTAINNLSDALDTIVLSDATDIILDEYTPAADGAYVAIEALRQNPRRRVGFRRAATACRRRNSRHIGSVLENGACRRSFRRPRHLRQSRRTRRGAHLLCVQRDVRLSRAHHLLRLRARRPRRLRAHARGRQQRRAQTARLCRNRQCLRRNGRHCRQHPAVGHHRHIPLHDRKGLRKRRDGLAYRLQSLLYRRERRRRNALRIRI